MIIALAGRRVDSADAKDPRFPLGNVERVRRLARAVLEEKGATALVSSAACGADLIALSEAGQLGLDDVADALQILLNWSIRNNVGRQWNMITTGIMQ